MKITFVYPSFDRHADSHPELREFVSCDEYLGPPSLGIASLAAHTPKEHEVEFIDDRVDPFDSAHEADLFAISCFTPAATRAFEIADALRARGKKVVMGGIFPTMLPAVAEGHCDSVVVGEGEIVWPTVIEDAHQGRLQSRYRPGIIEDLGMLAPPRLDLYFQSERDGHRPDDYPFQLTRGCPLRCDACVLPAQMGKQMRFHSDEYQRETIRQFVEAGKQISLTEDTSTFGMQGTRKHFREFLRNVVEMQAGGVDVRFSYIGISMPMILNLDPTLLELLHSTGIDRFYLVGGFDPITRKAFGQGDPEALEKARRAIARCHDYGIEPYVSFLVGNDTDDEGVFDRMLEFAQQTSIDLAEFCISTPYPGTPIWKRYLEEDRIFDYTWKHYNDANVVFQPHQMSVDRLQEGYLSLWKEFYRDRGSDLSGRERNRRTVQF